MSAEPETITTRCCIVGGGPAGMMLGFLLARAGVPVVLAAAAPFLRGHLETISSWDDVKTLTVRVDRLRTWHRPGLLCIGDAAHAMSPVGGVGINLAIQDAVAAANLLAPSLARRDPNEEDLEAVQRRREPAAKVTQRVQVFIHTHVLSSIFEAKGTIRPPWILRVLDRVPLLRRLPAYAVGIGYRPEHVR